MKIDIATAARFLATLAGDDEFTFQTFGEARPGTRSLTRVLHGTLERHAVTLESLNLKGAGAFVMVNRGNLLGRKATDVTGVRALFVDLDGAPVEPVLSCALPPRIVVETSPDKWHCYWPVVDMPVDRFTDAQHALATRFDSDPQVSDLSRVMRLPGFLHNKDTPFLTRLVTCEKAPITWSEMVQAFGLRDRFRLPEKIPKGKRNNVLFKLAVSAANKGVPAAEQLRKVEQVNASKCEPPLDPAEVAQVVASAYNMPRRGAVAMPHAVLDSDAYRALDHAGRDLLLMAYRRADSFGDFTLPHSELKSWFPRKDTFHAIRKRVVASGLMKVTKQPTKAMPRLQRGPKPGFYRLAIGPFPVAHSDGVIDPFGAAPEALQVLRSEAPDGCYAQIGSFESRRRAA